MTFLVLILLAMGKKINLSDKLILREALNQNNYSEIITLIKRIFKYTLFFELMGTIILSTVFIPEYGVSKGIFYSIFHSISAFCNSGIDILGNNSLINYGNNIIFNITIMLLIIIGGLGFTVWTDVTHIIKKHLKEKIPYERLLRELTLHSKIVLITTFILLVTGTLLIYLFEYNNITTMANFSMPEKLLKSAFQSTTLRTAGFSTINQREMTTISKLISICFMFVGGSPGSTAGGIKNVTTLIVIMLVITYMKDKEKIVLFKKSISESAVRRAIVVFAVSIFIVIMAIMGLLLSEIFIKEELFAADIASYYTISFIEIVFEVISAFGTVGLSLGITATLSSASKVIIILLMIIGRLRTYNNLSCFI